MTGIYELFAESADRHPDDVALCLDATSYTYGELRDMVLRLAQHLRDTLGEKPARVGLETARTEATYAAYLALLRLGHAVVPISADSSPARLDALTREASLDLVLTGSDRSGAGLAVPTQALRAALAGARHREPVAGGESADEDSVAYILFTSGSTGVPKGIPITHGNLLAYLGHVTAESGLTHRSRVSHTFALTFDPSAFDLFATWQAGAALVVPRGHDLLMPARYVADGGISHWFSVPSIISLATRSHAIPPGSMPGLRWSGFIGEPLTLAQARAWHRAAPNSVLENVYGPTEVTVACTGYRLPPEEEKWPGTPNETVPIGRPYPRVEHLVVGGDGTPGDHGELCVRGAQRFAGYLREQDNEDRFYRVRDGRAEQVRPVSPIDPSLWYRTGDVVAERDGDLVHLGRVDRQLKIRGYRIEPEEIETTLRQHPGVHDAVVTTSAGQGSVSLVAFVAGDEGRGADLRAHLAERLPVHLMPSRIVWIDALPVNARGKVDHKRIAAMAAGFSSG